MESNYDEECAKLEDMITAMIEAQPKTTRERMERIIKERSETKLDLVRKRQNEAQRQAKWTIMAFFGVILVIIMAIYIK